jgi:hypothetical protein
MQPDVSIMSCEELARVGNDGHKPQIRTSRACIAERLDGCFVVGSLRGTVR